MKMARTRTGGGTGNGGDLDGLLGMILALITSSTSTGRRTSAFAPAMRG
ncbi:hypothetical protein [Nocardia bhagyanarayanae]|uniref:Uncharacterized protein n=1 Tax=Nocardia bhagyanarayanae TaxID=1215925 RepID=A0A543F7L3_9NOCA|nr:hypothetical protein [Nocardia bhagyanarayanae]TQM29824.1 hypothetical protein FB390_1436 [Nocardia bhagyanarayanae]